MPSRTASRPRPHRRGPHRHAATPRSSPTRCPAPGWSPSPTPSRSPPKRLAAELDADAVDVDTLLARPDVDGVLITAPARSHTDLVVAAAAAGKHVFCEKPMAVTLADADRAIAAAEQAGVVLQVGFNRRFAPAFAAARAAIDAGRIGTPQLLRSLTRDPGPFTADPARIPQWTIFLETLIHDFDTLCFLNPGAPAGRGARVRRRAGRPRRQGARPPRHRRRHDPLRQRRDRDRRGQLLRRCTATTSAARCSAPAAWSPPATARATDMTLLRPRPASTSTPPAATPTCCARPTPASSSRSPTPSRGTVAGGHRQRRPHRALDRAGRIESSRPARDAAVAGGRDA